MLALKKVRFAMVGGIEERQLPRGMDKPVRHLPIEAVAAMVYRKRWRAGR